VGEGQARIDDAARGTGALLLLTTYPVSVLRTVAQRLRTTRDVTARLAVVRPSPQALARHQRAARALAEAELALCVADGRAASSAPGLNAEASR
jgi:hypothetical protein